MNSGGRDLTPEEFDVLLRNDFATFVQVMFNVVSPGVDLIWAPYLDLICSRVNDVVHGRRRNLIITMPPRHLKSFCISIALPAFLLGHYPSQEVMCVSYGQELARKFAEDCVTILNSETYIRAFGYLPTRKRQTPHFIRVKGGGARRATSLDGTATGVGGDVLIFDDPQKPGETLSDAVRKSTNEAFEQTFLSRLNNPGSGRMIIVMQRLHEDDFASHVLGLGGDWELLNLPAIAEQDEEQPFETFLGRHVFRRREGDPLHPKRLPLSELARIRASIGEAVWATQYQQRPAPAGGGHVQTKWFRRYAPNELPDTFDRVLQSWDTANKINEWNDYSVCTTWGVKRKNTYLLHVFRQKLDYPKLRRAVVEQAQVHGAESVYIEDRASGTQLLQELRAESFGRARAVKPVHDKLTRMINQTGKIENGFVFLPHEAPWLDDYLHELAVFPNGKNDDQVDSTSQALAAIEDYSDGRGIYEFFRQEAEAARVQAETLLRVWSPPEINGFSDREGRFHYRLPEGYFLLTAAQAGANIHSPGWSFEPAT